MSAYVVQDDVINKVVTYLASDEYLKRDLAAADSSINLADVLGQRQLAGSMFELNVLAVEQRYGKGEAASFRPLDFQYQPLAGVTRMGAFKSLRCWLYQCAEGDVPETALFKLMERLSGAIAISALYDTAEYNRDPSW